MKIRVHLKPNSKHDESVELIDDVYEVRVKAPAIDGKANQAAVRVLAEYFDVSKSQISLVQGHASKHKVFEIDK